jgi:hypothetical protein
MANDNKNRKRRSCDVAPMSQSKRSRRSFVNKLPAPDSDDWENWVSATETRSYLLRDPFLDYLRRCAISLTKKKPSFNAPVIKALTKKGTEFSFSEKIMDDGKHFEVDIVKKVRSNVEPDEFINIGATLEARSAEKAQDTLNAMNKGVPIIYNGLLHNYDDMTYGIPDFLVRSDWLDRLVVLSPLERKEARISAKNLSSIDNPYKPPKYHYVVVDVKFTTLRLRADGVNLLNSGSFPAFKGQLCIYNTALAKLQGYDPQKAYVLGKRWAFKSRAVPYKGANPLEKLGVVDFKTVDAHCIEATKKAVQWIRDVRHHGDEWDLGEVPLCRPELYPNMSNYSDYPWRGVKEVFADSIKEVSCLWQCGPAQRELAHSQGVYKWTDIRCTPKLLGMKEGKRAKTLSALIEINRDPKSKVLIRPAVILNNDCGWQQKRQLEFFVDFETISDVFPVQTGYIRTFDKYIEAMIFMIGVGYRSPLTGKWIFRHFTVPALEITHEKEICTSFSNYVREECKVFEETEPLLVHWSHAEPTHWDKAIEHHGGIEIAMERGWLTPLEEDDKIKPCWFDLMKVFRDEPIVVKGCMNFSLKNVARSMKDKGMIETIWDSSSPYSDGLGAMMAAYNASRDSKIMNITMLETPEMKGVAKYNEVDCKVMYEIITYLRKSHLVE